MICCLTWFSPLAPMILYILMIVIYCLVAIQSRSAVVKLESVLTVWMYPTLTTFVLVGSIKGPTIFGKLSRILWQDDIL